MIGRIIEYCGRKRLVVFMVVLFLFAWGYWALKKTPLDAIPDLSDTQVIILTEWPGRRPDLVENKIPSEVNPVLGPDATGVGWGFCYALVDETGQSNLSALRSFQDWNLKLALESVA